jgi:hypothetical protein
LLDNLLLAFLEFIEPKVDEILFKQTSFRINCLIQLFLHLFNYAPRLKASDSLLTLVLLIIMTCKWIKGSRVIPLIADFAFPSVWVKEGLLLNSRKVR